MSAAADPTTLYSQWCSTRKDLSLAISAFKRASEALSSLDRRLSALHEFIPLGVEEELPRLHSEGDQLYLAIADLKKLRNNSVTLAPINHLPAEILASVFTFAVDDSESLYPRPENAPQRVDFTTVLASVSYYWRQVALSTPALWSYINLVLEGFG
ncbi:hypothetical protein FRC10_001031 [Ceratobasidium sp. 414]|nr:hypothetical protein FRC10_001031 [Ceratobasidium sp. 414]